MKGFLVTSPTNIRYLTGFTGEGWLVLDGNTKYLLTDSRYTEEAKKIPDMTLISSLSRFKTLEFEEDSLTVGQMKKLKMKLIPTSGKIEALRIIKRKDEIENIRLAAKITRDTFKFISKRIRPGMTEARLAYELEGYLRVKGGDVAFPPIVAFNQHSSQPHYSARGNLPLRRGTLLQLDFGAKINGYCADMSRVVFFGPPKLEWVRAHETVSAAQQKVLSLLRQGEQSGAVLDTAAKKVIAEANFPPYEHGLGHGVGLDIHERPRLSVKKDEKLKPGMVFTVEPGIYIEGMYGIRIEDTVLLKKNGVEVL